MTLADAPVIADTKPHALLSGGKVTVSGFIDDDFFETPMVKASSVYVESINTMIWASSMHEETPSTLDMNVVTPVMFSQIVVREDPSSFAFRA